MMVIAEPIMRDIQITASQIGLMSSSYFLFYALTQPVVGILTDKFGPKKIILASFGLTVFTTILFALTRNYESAFLIRALMGISTGGIFIPSLKLFAAAFKPAEFSKLNGIYMGLGGAGGAFLATIPLTYMDVALGWRNSLFIYAIFGALLVIGIQLFVKTNYQAVIAEAQQEEEVVEDLKDYKQIVKEFVFSRNFFLLEIIFFISFGVYLSFQGLWATNYLSSVMNINAKLASTIIFALPLGLMIGSVTAGYISDRIFCSRTIPLRMALVTLCLSWFVLTYYTAHLSVAIIFIILFIAGYATGIISPMVFSIITDVVPSKARGVTFGLINPSSLVGIFVFQIVTGFILDTYMVNNSYTAQSYFMMMAFCMITLAVIATMSFFLKETMVLSETSKPVLVFHLPKQFPVLNLHFETVPIHMPVKMFHFRRHSFRFKPIHKA
jgi:MFS family permease